MPMRNRPDRPPSDEPEEILDGQLDQLYFGEVLSQGYWMKAG